MFSVNISWPDIDIFHPQARVDGHTLFSIKKVILSFHHGPQIISIAMAGGGAYMQYSVRWI